MLPLDQPRTIPDTPIYFCVDVGERGDHHFRVPRASVVGRLLMPLMESGLWDLKRDGAGAIDHVRADLLEEGIGAAIGVCWRHRTLELETKRRDFERGSDGLLEYGEEVMRELYEAGYSLEECTPMLNAVLSRLMLAVPTPPKEVGDLVGFTVPQKAGETGVIST